MCKRVGCLAVVEVVLHCVLILLRCGHLRFVLNIFSGRLIVV